VAEDQVNDDQNFSGDDDLGDPDLATCGQVNGVKQPRVAENKPRKMATRSQVADVVNLAEVRDKRLDSQQHSLATRGQKGLRKKQPHVAKNKPYIEPVKTSKGTWAFRLRWRESGKRMPPVYLSRVSDPVYEMIRGGDYERFKEQLIGSHNASAVRAGNRT
jgi:hypothetical protein